MFGNWLAGQIDEGIKVLVVPNLKRGANQADLTRQTRAPAVGCPGQHRDIAAPLQQGLTQGPAHQSGAPGHQHIHRAGTAFRLLISPGL